MYRILYFIIIASCVVVFVSCDSDNAGSSDELVGTWTLELKPQDSITFTIDGYYYDTKFNNRSKNFQGFIQKADGTIAEVNYGRLRYRKMSQEDDILVLSIYGEQNDLEFRRKGYLLADDGRSLIEVDYKMGAGIDDHIQIAQRYYKIGEPHHTSSINDSMVINIASEFDEDIFYVAFDQEDGRSDSPNTINLEKDNYIKVGFKENLRILMNGKVMSYVIDPKGKKQKIYTLQANDWHRILQDGVVVDELPVPLDSIIVIATSRFNPGRRYVNKIFQEDIVGNVLDFKYTSLGRELEIRGLLNATPE